MVTSLYVGVGRKGGDPQQLPKLLKAPTSFSKFISIRLFPYYRWCDLTFLGFTFLICLVHLRFTEHYMVGTVLRAREVKQRKTQALLEGSSQTSVGDRQTCKRMQQ